MATTIINHAADNHAAFDHHEHMEAMTETPSSGRFIACFNGNEKKIVLKQSKGEYQLDKVKKKLFSKFKKLSTTDFTLQLQPNSSSSASSLHSTPLTIHSSNHIISYLLGQQEPLPKCNIIIGNPSSNDNTTMTSASSLPSSSEPHRRASSIYRHRSSLKSRNRNKYNHNSPALPVSSPPPKHAPPYHAINITHNQPSSASQAAQAPPLLIHDSSPICRSLPFSFTLSRSSSSKSINLSSSASSAAAQNNNNKPSHRHRGGHGRLNNNISNLMELNNLISNQNQYDLYHGYREYVCCFKNILIKLTLSMFDIAKYSDESFKNKFLSLFNYKLKSNEMLKFRVFHTLTKQYIPIKLPLWSYDSLHYHIEGVLVLVNDVDSMHHAVASGQFNNSQNREPNIDDQVPLSRSRSHSHRRSLQLYYPDKAMMHDEDEQHEHEEEVHHEESASPDDQEQDESPQPQREAEGSSQDDEDAEEVADKDENVDSDEQEHIYYRYVNQQDHHHNVDEHDEEDVVVGQESEEHDDDDDDVDDEEMHHEEEEDEEHEKSSEEQENMSNFEEVLHGLESDLKEQQQGIALSIMNINKSINEKNNGNFTSISLWKKYVTEIKEIEHDINEFCSSCHLRLNEDITQHISAKCGKLEEICSVKCNIINAMQQEMSVQEEQIINLETTIRKLTIQVSEYRKSLKAKQSEMRKEEKVFCSMQKQLQKLQHFQSKYEFTKKQLNRDIAKFEQNEKVKIYDIQKHLSHIWKRFEISYVSWNSQEALQWILCIENFYFSHDKFQQFIETLKIHQFVGKNLKELRSTFTLNVMGLNDANDQQILIKHINRITNKSKRKSSKMRDRNSHERHDPSIHNIQPRKRKSAKMAAQNLPVLQLNDINTSSATHNSDRDHVTPTPSATSQGNLCCICAENEINTVIIPCGHMVYCSQCSKKMTVSSCPTCRSQDVKIMVTYKSGL